jgi:hypothetical protein
MSATHENLVSYDERDPPSIRAFGITIGAVLCIIGLFPFAIGSGSVRWWALGIGGAFLTAAFLAPQLLEPLNRLWFRLGMLLHRVINPLVLGLLFIVVITPVALALRLLGKRPIAGLADPEAPSYWITRDPPGPEAETIRNQF